MSTNVYLDRYAWQQSLFPDYQPENDLGLIVVIPCYKESGIIEALRSINACRPPKQKVLILVVINEPENASKEIQLVNEQTLLELKSYSSKYNLLYTKIQLPEKKAGVGLARKVGMDEAVRFFEKISKDGIIICYDADCFCESNYLTAITEVYEDPRTNAGIVFYEHLLNGPNKDEIINYELYLRYYIDALRYAGFSYAHQTLGSCITVRSSIYQKQGGMNTRKAGEDFYFLNKVIPLGGFIEINTTTIYPSDRVSDRVPFGTGKAVNDLLTSDETYMVYNPKSFEDLKVLFDQVQQIWNGSDLTIPETIQTFLGTDWKEQIEKVKSQTASIDTFTNRFFKWFDAFKILKYVHYARDHFYSNVELEKAIYWLGEKQPLKLSTHFESFLQELRNFDRRFTPNQTGSSPQSHA